MNTSNLVPEHQVCGEDADETTELLAMLTEARNYIASFAWTPAIVSVWQGIGIAGVLGVYLFRFAEKIGNDDFLWVVCGDLPSAYLVTDNASGPCEALTIYCKLMTEWVNAVKQGDGLEHVFPVSAPADNEHAEMLLTRVQRIRERIIPEYS